MKVIFVCRANVGRSQMAEAFFNRFSKTNKSISTGTRVKVKIVGLSMKELQKKSQEAGNVVKAMAEYDYDISSQNIKQLTKRMVEEADKVIVMCRKRTWPDFLKSSPKVEYWRIRDTKTDPLNIIKQTRDKIKEKVEGLVEKIG